MEKAHRQAITDGATRIFHIAAPGTDDIVLGLLERSSATLNGDFPPVLIVHGATFGATLFDLPLPGYSLLAELAGAGRSIYALDIRGYGHSLNGHVMDSLAEAHPPFARLDDAVADISAAFRFIQERERISAIDLVGFSWGTVASARFAGEHPDMVARLALYAPLYAERNDMWLGKIGDPEDQTRIDPTIGAYRMVTEADVIQRWNADIGGGDPLDRREKGIPEAIFRALSALDPRTRAHKPPAFRAPTGALVDLIQIFNGFPLYRPETLTMPVLLVRGADDTTSTDTDSRRLFAAIASTQKEYRVIDPGSHFLCVERNRADLFRCLDKFLVSFDKR